MTKKTPSYLKLHSEDPAEDVARRQEEYAGLETLCKAFRQATGWPLRYEAGESDSPWADSAPATSGESPAPGRLVVERPETCNEQQCDPDSCNHLPQDSAEDLADELGQLLGDLERARHVVWEREAELAAGVPVAPRPDEQEHLAARLEAVLQGGATAVGCQAAAVYLLDETTSVLKLRAAWGIPKDRFFEPARPLRGAVADLDALVGHAVVLEDTSVLPNWRPPEQFSSAVCVPVSTPTTPLGTMWVFAEHVRDFSSTQTNIIEIVAGRVAAELEREMLLLEGLHARQLDRQLVQAAGWQTDRLPRFGPLLDDWELAGWTSQAGRVGGDFHDWNVLNDGALVVAVGNAEGESIEASLAAAALQTAVRAHGCYSHDARQMLARVNETLWTGSVGGELASLFYALIQPESGSIDCCCAGRVGAILVRSTRYELLAETAQPLGAEPEIVSSCRSAKMRPGDVLLVVSEGVREARDDGGRRFDERTVARTLQERRDESAEQLVEVVRELIETHCLRGQSDDRTLLVVKRRP